MTDYNYKTASKRLGAVILAGGRGRRMEGSDKGLVKINNKTLIEIVLSQIQPYLSKIVISANRNIEQYQYLGHRVIQDSTPDYSGPLAGIVCAMDVINTELLFIVAVDIPELPVDIISKLLSCLDQQKADICCVQEGDRLQPLISIVRTKLKADLEQYLQQGNRKVIDWFQQQNLTTLKTANNNIPNLNTTHDLENYLK